MVSGLVTSPWDQERIFSGLAKLMRMESKSAIKLARSYGLLRYKVVSSSPAFAGVAFRRPFLRRPPGRLRTQLRRTSKTQTKKGTIYRAPTRSGSVGGLIGCRLLALHQLDVEA